MAWPDRRILDLFGIALPIIQAPMANFGTRKWPSRLPRRARSVRWPAPR